MFDKKWLLKDEIIYHFSDPSSINNIDKQMKQRWMTNIKKACHNEYDNCHSIVRE